MLQFECSALLPLHHGLIVATNREEFGVICGEHRTDDVLGVTAVRSGNTTLSARVAEEANETVVITGGQEHTIIGASNTVNVGTICARGVDTLSLPLELAGLGGPDSGSGVRSAGWILCAFGDSVEEELVSTTVRADVSVVRAPVQGHDVGVMGGAFAYQGEVLVGVVDVDIVVVGADSKIFVARGEGHNLNPLSGVLEELDLNLGSGGSPD